MVVKFDWKEREGGVGRVIPILFDIWDIVLLVDDINISNWRGRGSHTDFVEKSSSLKDKAFPEGHRRRRKITTNGFSQYYVNTIKSVTNINDIV